MADALVDRAVSEFGRLDILVTNAGILRDSVVWKMTDEQFDLVLDVHVRGTFTCVRAVANRFREQGDGGRVICIGSPTGQTGNFGQTNYAAVKAAIVGMVRTWSLELARAGVTVNAVIPVAATAMTETLPFLRPYVEALAAGQARHTRAASWGSAHRRTPPALSFSSPPKRRPASLGRPSVSVATGSLWTRPAEVAVEFADGDGWGADAIAKVWPSFAPHQQRIGQQFPEPPQ